MRRSSRLFIALCIFASLLVGVVLGENAIASPPSASPPAAPKTRQQIAAEAYSIEAIAKAAAGRKTNPSNDGVGPPATTGCAPNVAGMFCTANSTWNQVNVKLCGAQQFNLSAVHPIIKLLVTNSSIDGCGLDGVVVTSDSSPSEIYLWDNVTSVRYTFRNSTLKNFTSLVKHLNVGGNYRVGASIMRLDNLTISNFDQSYSGAAVTRAIMIESHDLTVSAYNRDDLAYCALGDNPNTGAYNGTLTFSLYRSKFTDTSGHLTGCVAGDNLHIAKYNYFEGGFLQLIYGADFQHGISPNFGTPTEVVNWSYNYANGSKHTVFGLYGTGTGAFSLHFGTNARATVFSNYVNNSRYIPYQFSGNQTGGRVIRNYIRGGIAGFNTLAFLIGGQDHGWIVDHNYIWDSDTSQNAGIIIGFAAHDITVSNNVLYDIGANAIRIDGSILKFKFPNATDASDYSWKGSGNLIVGNYVAGGTHLQSISVNSGYTIFRGNAVVSPPASGIFDMQAALLCGDSPSYFCTFNWVDWVDGFPDAPSIHWDAGIPAAAYNRVWVRSLRSGSLLVGTGLFVNITASNSTYWGILQAPRCVLPGAATYGQTTTDAEVLGWNGKACGPANDTTYFTAGLWIANHPENLYRVSGSLALTPVYGLASGAADLTVRKDDSFIGNIGTPWQIDVGHDYKVTRPGLGEDPMKTLGTVFPVFLYMTAMVLIMTAAYAIKKRRDGRP